VRLAILERHEVEELARDVLVDVHPADERLDLAAGETFDRAAELAFGRVLEEQACARAAARVCRAERPVKT
jgi:hypothetical protein